MSAHKDGLWAFWNGHGYPVGTVPTTNARHMDAYLAKLRAFMLVEAAPPAPVRGRMLPAQGQGRSR